MQLITIIIIIIIIITTTMTQGKPGPKSVKINLLKSQSQVERNKTGYTVHDYFERKVTHDKHV
jgi:hypothetical protein